MNAQPTEQQHALQYLYIPVRPLCCARGGAQFAAAAARPSAGIAPVWTQRAYRRLASRKRSLSRRYRLRTRMGMQPVVEHPVPGSARRATSPPRSKDATAPAANVHSSAPVTPAAINAKSNGMARRMFEATTAAVGAFMLLHCQARTCAEQSRLYRHRDRHHDGLDAGPNNRTQQRQQQRQRRRRRRRQYIEELRRRLARWRRARRGQSPAAAAAPARLRAPYVSAARRAPELPSHVDLTFADFLDRCLNEGRHHLKLDFKELDAVEPCLELLASRWDQLHANGMAIWLNADVLPGPNARRVGSCRVPAYRFLPLCRKLCPHAYLSLGWRCGPIGPEEVYAPHDIHEMQRVLREHHIPGSMVVFASALRLAERCVRLQGELLSAVPDSQLLLWTGTGELPIAASTQARIHLELARMGHAERVGFDVQIARSCSEIAGAGAIDCTFFWSRFCRTSVCCCCASHGFPCPSPAYPYFRGALELGSNGAASLREGRGASYGERQPLVIERVTAAA